MVKVWSVLLTVRNLASYFTGRIAPEERVIFFPTSAIQRNATHWDVPIHGWIFHPKEDSMKRVAFRKLLRRALQVPSRSTEEQILDHRIKYFVVDNARWKRPTITLAGKEYLTVPSEKNGHFQTNLTLSVEELRLHDSNALTNPTTPTPVVFPPNHIHYFALSSDGSRQYDGTVHLVPPEGITILSDIDDTIKITNVVNKREMLRNTFLKEFTAVPGMAEVYRQWCSSSSSKNGPHVHLHLLSASLYQLYEDLEGFRQQSGFPPATYTLKTIRPKKAKETIQTLLENPVEFKGRALSRLLEAYPRRQFVLVGDTGEKDPQVYASIAKKYPHQVLGVYLRSVAKNAEDYVPTRVEQIMKEYGVENDKWRVFEDASELLQVDLVKMLTEHQAAMAGDGVAK